MIRPIVVFVRTTAAWLCLALVCVSAARAQQIHAELVTGGLDHPVAFAQDPSQPTVQLVAEQRGRIRVLVDGALQATDYLDLSDVVSSNPEGGLLGLAFAPDYATSGRLFVNFTDANSNTVIARFTRAADEPLRADPASRFDLVWSTGLSFVAQPYCCHYGGHLAFGPDGYLYVALGDGGAWDDLNNNAQNPASLLGKVLRIDVSVGDADPRGYTVPKDNPFAQQDGVLPEIWDAGLRNPWRYSFDDPARGGTGAMVLADVGQDQWEEFDYEPAGAGGRNYGWRNREGANDYITTTPPWFEPLTDPAYEYPHDGGPRAIIGGYVYRGAALGSAFVGRYFFGDFMTGQLWSAGLQIDPASGEAVVADVREHTDDIGAEPLDYFNSFGEDAAGELYVVSWWHGTVYRIAPGAAPPVEARNVRITIDSPAPGDVDQPFSLSGWAIDQDATADTGIDYVEVWAQSHGTADAPILLGVATPGTRMDVASIYGPQFADSGFSKAISGLPPDAYDITAYAHDVVTQKFEASATVTVDVRPGTRVFVDSPAPGSTVPRAFTISGWAADVSATSGTGVDAVHVWAFPEDGGPALWVGLATYGGPRSDVGSAYGGQFTNVGFSLTTSVLPAGTYRLVAYAHSTVTGLFVDAGTRVVVTAPTSDPVMFVDLPAPLASVSGAFAVVGWAIDRAATTGTGVDAVHVWAFRVDASAAPIFLGEADLGDERSDIGTVFGAQFTGAGFSLLAPALPAGDYDVAVYMHSSLAGSFNAVRIVRVIVP